MYKLLLCWRYLRTRYIALVCIVSVMLGVATMIVVNSVMAGFSHEMQARMNGMLGDLILESTDMDGAPDAAKQMARIKELAGDDIVGMSPTVVVPALMYLDLNGQLSTQQAMLVGIDEETYGSVSEFCNYLQHPANRDQLRFQLRNGGYDVYDHQAPDPESLQPRPQMEGAGWPYRRHKARFQAQRQMVTQSSQPPTADTQGQVDPFQSAVEVEPEGEDFDPAVETHPGIILGMGMCSFRTVDGADRFYALPGDDVRVGFPKVSLGSSSPHKLTSEIYTIVDVYESKMSEYDSGFMFVPLRDLQESRGLIDPQTGIGRFTAIQIKLRPEANPEAVRDLLRNHFDGQAFRVSTWRDKQGPLLAAVQMETAVLNVLLFLIVAVAGFGILAIFYMIVVEKTRDIGILKSLGASGSGVMGIFLGYGLSLGLVGAGVGMAMGLLFVENINEIADLLGRISGQPVFDPSVYYFYKIPTIVDPVTVGWICAGAVIIAVIASVLPARRAARLHPVKALRYE